MSSETRTFTVSSETDEDGTVTSPTIIATGENASAVYIASLDDSENNKGYTNDLTEIAISGGTYSTDVSEYCAAGYETTQGEDGNYTLNTKTGYYEVSEYKSDDEYTYPTEEGKVFAGWYTDDTCEEVYSETSGMAYAKFVDAATMSIKGVVMKIKEEEDAEGTKYWRIVTGLDSLNYDAIGFEIYMGENTDDNDESTNISGYYWKDYTAQSANNRNFVATEFGNDSNYISVCLVSDTTSESCTVRSYWTTLDGTTVYGAWYNCSYTNISEGYSELTVTKVTEEASKDE
ncbi:MAG: hypothetical protein LUG52_04415 [Clostridia bacterium]|nr:hypothetical protein [Clostridia bacterium]